ncbi:hypothetical protein [Nonomuraea cavernae]|uniref:Uncharacterized protein n=1 Tax=Nonomuraea cavernae TaxID=2045107 RepID=A0A917YTW4_9ACTN|nr:hypothetical protein [Nonomuraea cavernae]MCA2185319.1 hypothetical protein [Nonomuraea cavernae]GGO66098.1 hypothetical protein GCM10012289_19300 [Nonomuraea cavernae]
MSILDKVKEMLGGLQEKAHHIPKQSRQEKPGDMPGEPRAHGEETAGGGQTGPAAQDKTGDEEV